EERRLDRRLAFVDERLDALLGLVERPAGGRPVGTRQLAERLHALGQQAVAPEEARLGIGKRVEVAAGGDEARRFIDEGLGLAGIHLRLDPGKTLDAAPGAPPLRLTALRNEERGRAGPVHSRPSLSGG